MSSEKPHTIHHSWTGTSLTTRKRLKSTENARKKKKDLDKKGKIRVGRMIVKGNTRDVPFVEGYTTVVVHTENFNKWSSLSPYVLKKEGQILENIWHAHKVWKEVPAVKIPKSRWDPKKIIWERGSETHVDENGVPNETWKKWHNDLCNNEYAVRYPAGFKNKKNTLYSWKDDRKLSYIEARKEIYAPLYIELVQNEAKFKELMKMVEDGKNILIVEVDGPHQESLDYYIETYGVGNDFIVDHTIKVTKKNFSIMLYDEKHSFGHGYCLAMALFGMTVIDLENVRPPMGKKKFKIEKI